MTPSQPLKETVEQQDKSPGEAYGGQLGVGCFVQLSGLKSAPDLVGQRGRLESLDASTGRWLVKLPSERLVKVQPLNLIVVPRLLSCDPGEALVQKQEGDFIHRSNHLCECVQKLYYHTAPESAGGATFHVDFKEAWNRMSVKERENVLRSADEALLIEQGQAGPFGMLAAAFAATELRDEAFVKQPQDFIKYLEAAMTPQGGHAGFLPNDAFMQRLCLGTLGFNVEELKGHPAKLDLELRIICAYGFYFRAEFALKVVDSWLKKMAP